MANDAVVIDLMKMTAVRVDPEKNLVFVQAGADGGDVDHETALHDLICITCSVSHTGFAGVALGGGIGHLSRWLGAVVDSIVGYEMVSAAGKAKEVMTPWMARIADPERKETETLQFAFLHSPDGHPVCGVVPLIVGETEAAAKATCDELAAYGGWA